MNLFAKESVSTYCLEQKNRLEYIIDKITDEEILNCDLEESIDYYYDICEILPIVVFKEKTEKEIDKIKVKKYNSFYRSGAYDEPEYWMVDGYKVNFKIYFDGNYELFDFKPSTYTLTRYDVEAFERPKYEKDGYFVISFEYASSSLKDIDISKKIMDDFNKKSGYFFSMIDNINNDVELYNSSLRDNIKKLLEKRKEKADEFNFIKNALEIPLVLNENAPNIKPIKLKKEKKINREKPKIKQPELEYTISDDDYLNILRIIHSSCSSFQVTARTSNKLNEEELRDLVLANISSHYVVTGETFRKNGKTDINISFENKAAFVGECKMWTGIKNFEKAINQLFGYTTWKDKKLALIVFNNKTKSFTKVLSAVEEWIKEHTTVINKSDANFWQCKMYRDDIKDDVKIAIMVYDITI